jgi:hypothetical protein
LDYARKVKNPKKLPWPNLRGLAAAMFMVFVPCRPCAMVRMDTSKAWVRKTDGAIIVPAQEKTDYGKGVTELVFRKADEKRLSAAYFYEVLDERALSLGCENALFCSDKGIPYSSPDVIGKSLVQVLQDMGVPGYTGYSFRHSLIQALFDAGLDEKQVNAYTGHSNTAHTVINWYYHLDKQWAGQKIRTLSAEAKRAIENDGAEDGDDWGARREHQGLLFYLFSCVFVYLVL